jgi:hypothetical protein
MNKAFKLIYVSCDLKSVIIEFDTLKDLISGITATGQSGRLCLGGWSVNASRNPASVFSNIINELPTKI